MFFFATKYKILDVIYVNFIEYFIKYKKATSEE